MRVEERQRLAGSDRLDRDLGEFHRHRISVDAKQVPARRLAQPVAKLRRRWRALAFELRDPRRETTRAASRKVPRAASRIDNLRSSSAETAASFVNAQPDEATARALQDHVKQTIAPYKYPRAIAFVEHLPRTHTGKLQRFRLRDAP